MAFLNLFSIIYFSPSVFSIVLPLQLLVKPTAFYSFPPSHNLYPNISGSGMSSLYAHSSSTLLYSKVTTGYIFTCEVLELVSKVGGNRYEFLPSLSYLSL